MAPNALVAAAAMLLACAAAAEAGGWRPAGTRARSDAAVRPAAWQAAPPPAAVPDGFDPFDQPLTDGDAVMPEADAASVPPDDAQFDPFDMPVGDDPASEAVGDDPAAMPESPPVDADVDYDVREAFDEPQTTALGPGVSDELEDAGRAIDEEIIRRKRDEPATAGPPIVDTPDPFQPQDDGADDAPADDAADEGITGEDLEEAFPEPGANDDDFDNRLQPTPDGGFDIRPLEPGPQLTPEQEAARRRQLEQERIETEKNCEQIIADVKADDIKTVSLDIRLHGEPGEDFPFECGFGRHQFEPRTWGQVTYLWKASGLCHKPLYFEQVQLERHGHSWGPVLDPLVSGAHFFVTLPILPYKMGLTTPNECVYTLGHYRPGSCAPYLIEAVPFTWRAAAFEGAAWTAGSFIIP